MIAPIAAVWIAELEDLIAELREARDACKDARAAEFQLRHQGEPLGSYISLPGGAGLAGGFGAGTMTDQKNYYVGNRTNDPTDPFDTNF